MSWKWKEEDLDLILVPCGLLIMFSYHLFLLYRYLKFPLTTVMGCEDHYKRVWVKKIMQLNTNDKGPSLSVINGSMSAATSLSSICLVLSSLIGAWIGSLSDKNTFVSSIIYGNSRPAVTSIKYISVLCCFLVAFASFVQTIRSYVLAAFLISLPNTDIPEGYVEKPIIRASNFWALGMRALYFSATLILWIFGPMPMLVSSISLVAVLHNLDMTSSPPYQFRQHSSNNNPLQKIGEELAVVSRAFAHQG